MCYSDYFGMGGTVVASQQGGPGFDHTISPSPFYVEFACSHCVRVGSYLQLIEYFF